MLVLSSYLPFPEMITDTSTLRNSLRFLCSSNLTRTIFKQCLKEPSKSPDLPFINGIAKLRWVVSGRNLPLSLHHFRLETDYCMTHRPPIPMVARCAYQTSYKDSLIDVTDEVRLFPACLIEYRMKLVPLSKMTGNTLSQTAENTFRKRLKSYRSDIEKALLMDSSIDASFSDIFESQILKVKNPTSGVKFAYQKYNARCRVDSGVIRVETLPSATRLFLDRILDSISYAQAHRIMIPSLWNTLRQHTENPTELKQISECLLINYNPRHYLYSDKISPHILPHSYERKVFEVVSQWFDLLSMTKDVTRQFASLIKTLPFNSVLKLVECSEPIRSDLSTLTKRTLNSTNVYPLKPPLSTVFDYLAVAYLRDSYVHEDDPSVKFIVESRRGARNARQIVKGCKRVEQFFGIKDRVKKNLLYPSPGQLILELERIGLVSIQQHSKTSSNYVFRINKEADTSKKRLLHLSKSLKREDIKKLGV